MADVKFKLVHISDLHFDPTEPQGPASLRLVKERIEQLAPDVIIATGDISAEGHHHEGRLQQIKEYLSSLPAPAHAVPGNHDVGNKAGVPNDVVQEGHVDRWCSVFGSDHFVVERDGWLLIGVDSQVIGSGFDYEAAQFAWLDELLDRAEKDGLKAAMFMHTPPYLVSQHESWTGRANYWALDPEPRRSILKRIHRDPIKLVAHGHLHWHLHENRNGALWVWCPSLSFIVDDATFPRGGGVCGFLQYTFTEDDVSFELVPMDLPIDTIWIHRPQVDLPGKDTIIMAELVIDFSGTLSLDGHLLPGVADRIRELGHTVRITVLTADTFNKAPSALAGLPVDIKRVRTGQDKLDYVKSLGPERVVAIGNGRNDALMCREAVIGIAVEGPEGVAADLVRDCDLVVKSVNDALDLVANPLRLKATLRD